MKVSPRLLELCRIKYGKGLFYDLELIGHLEDESPSEETIRQEMEELSKSGLVETVDEEVHISPLGQHIFKMMIEPEIYLYLNNALSGRTARIYILNSYYLCAISESKNAVQDDYLVELLPRLDLVVGSFVYALTSNEEDVHDQKEGACEREYDLQARGTSWKADRKVLSEISIYGKIHGDNTEYEDIRYSKIVSNEYSENSSEEGTGGISELTNELTSWMLKNISDLYYKE